MFTLLTSPVAVPSVAIDNVTMISCDTVPFIKDTLTLMLPASSRTEYVVESKPSITTARWKKWLRVPG